MFPVIAIGPLAIQAPALILLLSLWIGIWITGKFAANLGTNGDCIETGLLYGLLAGILGARVGYLLQNPSVFMNNPLSVVSLTPSMLDGSFGLLTTALTMAIIYQKKHLPLWPTLDTATPLMLILFIGIHLADYANGNNYGLPTTLPWGISLWNATRHPVQLYILLLTLILLTWFLIRTRIFRLTGFMRSGVLFSSIIAGLALIAIVTRSFAAEKIAFLGADLVQMIALVLLIASFYLIYHQAYKTGKPVRVFLSLGANRHPRENLVRAGEMLAEEFVIRSKSNLYQTEDVRQKSAKSQYLNQVLEIETEHSYSALLTWCKDLEKQFGRQPGNKNDVPLDVDIIAYNKDVFSSNGNQIPDPDLLRYSYIALPLAEIAPDFRHPGTGQSIQNILTKLNDSGQPIEKSTEVENGTQR